jgi:hypothetical protein
MATDPYAGIRSLDASAFKSRPAGGVLPGGVYIDLPDNLDAFDSKYLNATKDQKIASTNPFRARAGETIGSKKVNYGVEELPDGRVIVRGLQQPGEDKYDTLDAVYKIDPATGKYVMQGDPVKTRQESSLSRVLADAAGIARTLAPTFMPGLGEFATNALGVTPQVGSAVAGAGVGGTTAAMAGQDPLKGALVGGIGGYLSKSDLLKGFTENADPQFEPGLVDAPSYGDFLGEGVPSGIPNWDNAFTNAGGVLDTAYGIESLAGSGAGFPGEGVDSGVPDWDVAQDIAQNPTVPTGADPTQPTQTIEITGEKYPGSGAGFPGEGALSGIPKWDEALGGAMMPPATPRESVGNMEGLTPPTLATENQIPDADPRVAVGNMEGLEGPSLGSKFLDWAKSNPIQAMQLVTGIGGLISKGIGGGSGGGGGGSTGPGPQAGMTVNKPAAMQRQYVAPPAGYRAGFDPEHRFFTGIGSPGVGS